MLRSGFRTTKNPATGPAGLHRVGWFGFLLFVPSARAVPPDGRMAVDVVMVRDVEAAEH